MTSESERSAAPQMPLASRRRARVAALQMLYAWEVGRVSLADIQQTYWNQALAVEEGGDDDGDGGPPEAPLPPQLQALAIELATGVAERISSIDPVIAEAADNWRVERMPIIDRLIVRLAVYELQHHPQTPARVVINEALELARTFSTDDAVRFINGVLDGIRRAMNRSAEDTQP